MFDFALPFELRITVRVNDHWRLLFKKPRHIYRAKMAYNLAYNIQLSREKSRTHVDFEQLIYGLGLWKSFS